MPGTVGAEDVGRKGFEPSSLGLKARCSTVGRTSRHVIAAAFVSSAFSFFQMRQRPPRSILSGLCGCVEMTLLLLRIVSFADADLPLEARRGTHVPCHPRVYEGQIHGIGLNDPWVMHYRL